MQEVTTLHCPSQQVLAYLVPDCIDKHTTIQILEILVLVKGNQLLIHQYKLDTEQEGGLLGGSVACPALSRQCLTR